LLIFWVPNKFAPKYLIIWKIFQNIIAIKLFDLVFAIL